MPSNDARWIIGAIVLLAGLLVTQHAGMTNRMDRIEDRLGEVDARLRAVEVAFGKVDQRLATLERLHLPTPSDGD